MKALAIGMSVVLLAGVSAVVSAQEAPAEGEGGVSGLVPAAVARDAAVDESILKVVIANMDRHLQKAPMEVPVIRLVGADTLVGEAEALASVRPEQAVCVIGLIKYVSDLETFGAVVPESRSGVINVAALAEGAGEDSDLLAKRVSKEAVNAALLLNGLKPCPNPRCALFTCADVAGIDQKGFGACPPCLYRYLDNVKERGMTVRPLGQ